MPAFRSTSITGSPTSAATYTFKVSGTDSASNSFTSSTITLVINTGNIHRQVL